MNKSVQYLLTIGLVFGSLFLVLPCFGQATITWTGVGGDGFRWADPLNWDLSRIPISTDEVIIANGDAVEIDAAGQVAQILRITGSSLTISSGDLTIDNQFVGDGIVLKNNGALNISADATLNIYNTDLSSINVSFGTGRIDNAGTILIDRTVAIPSGSDGASGILVSDNGILNLTNQVTGVIKNLDTLFADFLLIGDPFAPPLVAGSPNSSIINRGLIDVSYPGSNTSFEYYAFYFKNVTTFDNYGTIQIDSTEGEGMFLLAESRLTNHVGSKIQMKQIDVTGIELRNTATLINDGTIEMDSLAGIGFNLRRDATITNNATGIIQLNDIGSTSIGLDTRASFINNGTITITQNIGDAIYKSKEAIDLEDANTTFTNNGTITITGTEDAESLKINGTFTNNCLINVGIGNDMAAVIGVNSNGFLANTSCGVINITTADSIDNDMGQIFNEGIITTPFTGVNTNTGNFTNDGLIISPTVPFSVSNLLDPMSTGVEKIGTIPADKKIIGGRDTTVCSPLTHTFNLSSLLTGTLSGNVSYGTTFGTYPDTITKDVTINSTTTFYIRDSIEETRCSDTAKITVTILAPNTFPTQPVNDSVCIGDNAFFTAEFTISVDGSVASSFFWEGNFDNTNFNQITGLDSVSFDLGNTPSSTTLQIPNVANSIDNSQFRYIIAQTSGTTTCYDTSNLVSLIIVKPTIDNQSINATVCNGSNTFFGVDATANDNGQLTYQWQESSDGATFTNLSNDAVFSDVDKDTLRLSSVPISKNTFKYRVIITETAGTISCNDTADIVMLTVNALPIITIANQAVCADATTVNLTNLEPAGQTGGTWKTGSTTITDATSVTVSNNQVFSYDFTDGNSCTGTDNVTYTVNALPVITIANQTVCADATTVNLTSLEPAGQTGGTWKTGSTTITDATSITVSNNQVFSYDFTDGNSCTGTDNVTYTVNPLPVINISNQAVCADATTVNLTNLEPAGQTGGTWKTGSTTITDATSITVSNNQVFSYDFTDGNSCTGMDNVTYTVNALPVINIANQTVCADATTVNLTSLEPAGQTGGTWKTGSTTITDATSITVSNNQVFSYDFTDGNSCTGTDNVTYTVNALPVINIANQAVCADATTVNLTNLEPVGQTGGTWKTGSTTITDATSVTVSNNQVFSYDFTDGNSCTGTDNVTYTVNALPVINIANQVVCADATTVNLTNLEPAGQTGGTWKTGSTTITDATSITVSNNQVFSYDFTDGSSCTGTDNVTYTVNELPVINIANQAVCADATTVNLTNLEPAGQTGGTWKTGSTTIADATSVTVSNNQVFSYDFTDGNSCTGTDNVTYTVNALPIITIANQTVCADATTVNLTSLEPAGQTGGTWKTGSTTITDATSVTVSNNQVFSYDFTDGNSCTGTDNVTYTVNALPVITIANQTVCADATTVNLTSLEPAGQTGGTWKTGSTTITDATSITVSNNQVFSYDFTDGNSCTGTDNVTYTVNTLPIITIADQAVCADATTVNLTNLEPAGQTGGTWKTGSTTITDATSVTVSNNQVFSYDFTDENSCTGTDNIRYTVNALPIITIADQAVCANATTVNLTNLEPAGQTGGTWKTGSTTITNATSVTVSNNQVFSYDFTDGNSCTGTDNVTFTINPLPIISGTFIFCADNSTNLTGSGTPATLNPWQSSNEEVATVNNNGVVTGISGGTSMIIYTDINGCQANQVVTVEALSVGGTITSLPMNCDGTDIVVLTLSGQIGTVLKWQSSTNMSFSNPVDINNTASTITIDNMAETTYFRTIVQNGSCPSTNSGITAVALDPLPVEEACPEVIGILGYFNRQIPTSTYQASERISSTGIIDEDHNVTYKAGESIALYPCFHAKAGSNFHAFIENCDAIQTIVSNNPTQERTTIGTSTPMNRTSLKFKVSPNPFVETTKLNFNLPQTDYVSIQIFNQAGQMIQQILRTKQFDAGNHEVLLTNEMLLGGMYYIILQTTQERITRKVILLNNGRNGFLEWDDD